MKWSDTGKLALKMKLSVGLILGVLLTVFLSEVASAPAPVVEEEAIIGDHGCHGGHCGHGGHRWPPVRVKRDDGGKRIKIKNVTITVEVPKETKISEKQIIESIVEALSS